MLSINISSNHRNNWLRAYKLNFDISIDNNLAFNLGHRVLISPIIKQENALNQESMAHSREFAIYTVVRHWN